MSWPIESVKKVMPDLAAMATNQGSTSTIIQAMPVYGRSAKIQRAERSRIASVMAVSATNIKISGPLISTPPASAVQNIAGSRQPGLSCGALRWLR